MLKLGIRRAKTTIQKYMRAVRGHAPRGQSWKTFIHNQGLHIWSYDFLWLAFLVANTLGTAAGDYLADEVGMGFSSSAVLMGSILAVVALAHRFTAVSGVFLFWVAFVMTRPFGATFGDLLTKSTDEAGLGLGTYLTSAALLACLLAEPA